jgi:hypothetical protein
MLAYVFYGVETCSTGVWIEYSQWPERCQACIVTDASFVGGSRPARIDGKKELRADENPAEGFAMVQSQRNGVCHPSDATPEMTSSLDIL